MTGSHSDGRRRAVVLLGKSAFASSPVAEMRRLAARMQSRHPELLVGIGFSEQGIPSLRETLLGLRRPAIEEVLILPLPIPLESSLTFWLRGVVARWQTEEPGRWPAIRIASPLGESAGLPVLLDELLAGFDLAPVEPMVPPAEGAKSTILPQRRRVLVCQGPDCNMKGATALWGHLRNVQQRRGLRTEGEGTMTAMCTCLGPCNLAPVLQVFPEGTYYCGVTEADIDRIADEHLLRGRIVADLAYPADGTKQTLRIAPRKELA